MLAPPQQLVNNIMRREVDFLYALATREAIARHPAWSRVHTLPVIDSEHHLLGALRYETLRQLETELRTASGVPDRSETAAALAELYGIGLSSLFEWTHTQPGGLGQGRRPTRRSE
jgi:hypothetical protein